MSELVQGEKQTSVLLAARDRGVILFEAFANSPPWFMTVSGDPRYGLCQQQVCLEVSVCKLCLFHLILHVMTILSHRYRNAAGEYSALAVSVCCDINIILCCTFSCCQHRHLVQRTSFVMSCQLVRGFARRLGSNYVECPC